jgi:hypothetical protein
MDASGGVVGQAVERIVGDEPRRVEVEPVGQAHQVGHGRRADGRFNHAAEHDAHAQFARPAQYGQSGRQSADLHQLQVDAADAGRRQPLHVGQRLHRLVGHDRHGAGRLNPAHALVVAFSGGLLNQGDAEFHHPLDLADGLVGRPAGIGVNVECHVGAGGAHGGHALDVATVGPAQLELDDRAAGERGGAPSHGPRLVDSQRERRWQRPRRGQAEQGVERLAVQPAEAVMERQVERGAGRCRAICSHVGEDIGRVVGEGVGATGGRVPPGGHGLGRDAVVGWDSALAPAFISGQAQPVGNACVARAVADAKRVA